MAAAHMLLRAQSGRVLSIALVVIATGHYISHLPSFAASAYRFLKLCLY
jgi:hypothetical protein